jgi:hypothetical protein
MSWRSGFQVSDTERPVYTELTAGFQLGIREGARSFQLSGGFIKQNLNFKNSQELKGRPENCKK